MKKERKEISVKKCTSEIFWNRVAHLLWMYFVYYIVIAAIASSLNSLMHISLVDNAIVIMIISCISFALIDFFAVKLTNRYMVKKYIINKDILKKVEKTLLIISIILSVLLLVYDIVELKSAVNESYSELEKLKVDLDEAELILAESILAGAITQECASTIIGVAIGLIIELVMVKYLIFDLEKRIDLDVLT